MTRHQLQNFPVCCYTRRKTPTCCLQLGQLWRTSFRASIQNGIRQQPSQPLQEEIIKDNTLEHAVNYYTGTQVFHCFSRSLCLFFLLFLSLEKKKFITSHLRVMSSLYSLIINLFLNKNTALLWKSVPLNSFTGINDKILWLHPHIQKIKSLFKSLNPLGWCFIENHVNLQA